MIIRTNCTNDRKVMVRRLADHLGVQAEYLGVPNCGYRVGQLTVDRYAVIAGDPELLRKIVPFLLEHGYIREAPEQLGDFEAPQPAEESTATVEEDDPVEDAEESVEENTQDTARDDSEAHTEDVPQTETEASPEETVVEEATDEELDSKADQPITQVCVGIPLAELTAPALINILKLIYSRQTLIATMTLSDRIYIHEELMDLLQDEKPDIVERICELLQGEVNAGMVCGIEIHEDRLSMSIPHTEAEPTRWKAAAELMTAIVDRAKTAHHINGKRIEPEAEEMKYFCRNWLIQLGLGGAAHKETQQMLLGHLTGFAAFRSTAKMNAHKAKYAALRRERREEEYHEED